MEEEFDIRELFHLMNSKDGEFFIRVLLSEEGELYGEKAGSGLIQESRIYHVESAYDNQDIT